MEDISHANKPIDLAAMQRICDSAQHGFTGHVCGPINAIGTGAPRHSADEPANGIGIPLARLNKSPGRPKGARNLHAKHPSSLARRFKRAGLDWADDFAKAIQANKRERIQLWLKLLPYMVTTTNKLKVRKWKGKASRAAIVALDALEGRE
jgi:hypothetical protein